MISDAQLAAAAVLYFGGSRARALHVMTCDRCLVDGDAHVICPNHPDRRRGFATSSTSPSR